MCVRVRLCEAVCLCMFIFVASTCFTSWYLHTQGTRTAYRAYSARLLTSSAERSERRTTRSTRVRVCRRRLLQNWRGVNLTKLSSVYKLLVHYERFHFFHLECRNSCLTASDAIITPYEIAYSYHILKLHTQLHIPNYLNCILNCIFRTMLDHTKKPV